MSVTVPDWSPSAPRSLYHALVAVIVVSLTCAAYKIQVFADAEFFYKAIRLMGFVAIAMIAVKSIATSLTNIYALISVLFVTLCIMFSTVSGATAYLIPAAISIAAVSLTTRSMASEVTKAAAFVLLMANVVLIVAALVKQGPFSLLLSVSEVGMTNQNYIAAAVFSTILLSLAQPTKLSKCVVAICFIALLILQSRTGLLATVLVLFYIATPMKRMLIALTVLLFAPWLIDLLQQKYQSDDLLGAASGRTGPWNFYLIELIRSPQYFLPEIMRMEPGARFFSSDTGAYHGPHNVFIQIVLSHGWLLGATAIIFTMASLAARSGPAKTCLIGCLIYGFFEPTIWFVDSLPGFIFICSLTVNVRDFLEQMGAKNGHYSAT